MRTVLEWVIVALNVLAILFGLRQYARGQHDADVADAYKGLISRGLLDESKTETYAKAHNGWHVKDRLHSIGDPDGFVQMLFAVGIAVCVGNIVAILLLSINRDGLSAEHPQMPTV